MQQNGDQAKAAALDKQAEYEAGEILNAKLKMRKELQDRIDKLSELAELDISVLGCCRRSIQLCFCLQIRYFLSF